VNNNRAHAHQRTRVTILERRPHECTLRAETQRHLHEVTGNCDSGTGQEDK